MELLLTEGMVYKKGHFSQQDILIQGGSISKITTHTSYHFSKALEFKNLYIIPGFNFILKLYIIPGCNYD